MNFAFGDCNSLVEEVSVCLAPASGALPLPWASKACLEICGVARVIMLTGCHIGLLPLLKSIQKHTELKKFAGETLGIDAYGWLHRGTISCAIELAQDKPTRK